LYILHNFYPQLPYCFAAIHRLCIFIARQRVFSQTAVTCHFRATHQKK
jgi:hypothetical protein